MPTKLELLDIYKRYNSSEFIDVDEAAFIWSGDRHAPVDGYEQAYRVNFNNGHVDHFPCVQSWMYRALAVRSRHDSSASSLNSRIFAESPEMLNILRTQNHPRYGMLSERNFQIRDQAKGKRRVFYDGDTVGICFLVPQSLRGSQIVLGLHTPNGSMEKSSSQTLTDTIWALPLSASELALKGGYGRYTVVYYLDETAVCGTVFDVLSASVPKTPSVR